MSIRKKTSSKMKGLIIALFAVLVCVAAGRERRRPSCPEDNSIDVLLPDRNCNRFWQCSNGVAIRRRCPRGLNFNPKLRVCDWPCHAGCTGQGWEALPRCECEFWRPECRDKIEPRVFDEYSEHGLE